MQYDILLVSLAIDLVAITVLTYAIYFRRHRRRDLTLGFIGVNVGLFAVASFVSIERFGVGFGIGLFALLSVIRLRSTQISQEEIGYYFVALVIGLVNGLSSEGEWAETITITAVLVGAMFVADHPRLLARYRRQIVVLKSVIRSDAELRRVLEHKLNGKVVRAIVLDLDFVHKRTKVDVRFLPNPSPRIEPVEPAEVVAVPEDASAAPLVEPAATAADATPTAAPVGVVPTAAPPPRRAETEADPPSPLEPELAPELPPAPAPAPEREPTADREPSGDEPPDGGGPG